MAEKIIKKTDEVAYKVHRSWDYDKFKILELNRDVKSIAKVKKSIEKNGYYRQPILVNERFEIIDGQHRFFACKELGLPIEYIIQVGLRVNSCAPLNSGMVNWSSRDYIRLFSQDNPNYAYFNCLAEQFPEFTPQVIYAATGRNLTGGGVNKMIKNETIKCNEDDYTKGQTVLTWLRSFKDDIKCSKLHGSKDALYLAMVFARNSPSVYLNILTKKLHAYFEMYGKSIGGVEDAIEKTERIYNWKRKTENSVDLVSEYRHAIRRTKTNESEVKSERIASA